MRGLSVIDSSREAFSLQDNSKTKGGLSRSLQHTIDLIPHSRSYFRMNLHFTTVCTRTLNGEAKRAQALKTTRAQSTSVCALFASTSMCLFEGVAFFVVDNSAVGTPALSVNVAKV